MLTNIENRLEELFEQIEMMPPEKVEMAEKVKHLAISLFTLVLSFFTLVLSFFTLVLSFFTR